MCSLDYKKSFKTDHIKLVKLLEKLNQYYCKKFNLCMLLSDEDSHLKSDDHKNKTKQLLVWCEGCGKNITNKTRYFQSQIHLQENQQSNFYQGTRSTFGMRCTFGLKIIVNQKT